jgi:uracil-DNA glycosylase family 4
MDDRRRQRKMKELRAQIKACGKCERMNIPGVTQAAPGWGSVDSPVVLVGQSLCHDCMESQIPFTGGSGRLIWASIKRAGIDKPDDVFITNVVHCHPHSEPVDSRASKRHEIDNCTPYLVRELDIVKPELVIGLGNDAKKVLRAKHPPRPESRCPGRFDGPGASRRRRRICCSCRIRLPCCGSATPLHPRIANVSNAST